MAFYNKTCISCKTNFISTRKHANTCSSSCRSRVFSFLHKKEDTINICIICKRQFTTRFKNQKTCSKLCRYKKKYINSINSDLNRLKKTIRSRVYDALAGKLKPETVSTSLGCSWNELRVHIESKFYPNPITGEEMSWKNRSLWHIDHIVPLCKFDLTNKEQFMKACHFSNLQPLWALDNLKKGSKI